MQAKQRELSIFWGLLKFNFITEAPPPEPKEEGKAVYNNCVFGQPFLIQPKQPALPTAEETRKVIEYVSSQTGLNEELVERVFETAGHYYKGEK
jgi:hypothetical protein